MPWLKKKDEQLFDLKIYIQPGAHKNEIVGLFNDCLKIKIKSPPIDGLANDELIDFLRKKLTLKNHEIGFIRGEKSRNKTLFVIGLSEEQIRLKLK